MLVLLSALVFLAVSSEAALPANLDVPLGYEQYRCAYAVGHMVYHKSSTGEWELERPFAVLSPKGKKHPCKADKKPIGIHYEGPTWQMNNGRKIEAERILAETTMDENAVDWLLVEARNEAGKTEYIQRTETRGGLAPTGSEDYKRDEILVPYSAEYCFYRLAEESSTINLPDAPPA